jgi:hypothetical protein
VSSTFPDEPTDPVEAAARAVELASSPVFEDRQRAALFVHCPVSVLDRLFLDSDHRVSATVAARPVLPSCVVPQVERCLRDWDRTEADRRVPHSVRVCLADRRPVEPELAALLASDFDDAVRSELARNPSCPQDVLDCLAGDAHQMVRATVAANSSTSQTTMDRLVSDTSAQVRHGVARRFTTPPGVLAALTFDESEPVRTVAVCSLLGHIESGALAVEVLDPACASMVWAFSRPDFAARVGELALQAGGDRSVVAQTAAGLAESFHSTLVELVAAASSVLAHRP